MEYKGIPTGELKTCQQILTVIGNSPEQSSPLESFLKNLILERFFSTLRYTICVHLNLSLSFLKLRCNNMLQNFVLWFKTKITSANVILKYIKPLVQSCHIFMLKTCTYCLWWHFILKFYMCHRICQHWGLSSYFIIKVNGNRNLKGQAQDNFGHGDTC